MTKTYDEHVRAYAMYQLNLRWDMLNIVWAIRSDGRNSHTGARP